MKITFAMLYLVGLMVLFVFCAIVWHWQMAGTYFVCEQKGVIADFVPPFVQSGSSGNMYLRPQSVVYTIWAVYAGVTIIVPAISAWLLVRMHDRALKKSWT